MKILLLTDRMDIGGVETHILTLIEELIGMGCDITLMTSGGVYLGNLSHRPVKIIIAPLDKRNPISISRSFAAICKAMKECDAVHAHTRFCAFLSTKSRGRSSYPPIVTTAHLNFPTFPFGPLTKWGDITLAVSSDIAEYLKSAYSIGEENIRLTKNGINEKLYSIERKKRNLIIHTSRIDKGRSLTAFALTECAKKLLKDFPDWRILIAGDGNQFKALKAKAQETNVALGFQGIILLGKRNDIPSILAYGKIFVGVSRAALEGMAAGLATVISGDEGYCGILSPKNEEALIYTNFCARGMPPLDTQTLYRDLKTLIETPSIAASSGEFGSQVIKNHFKPSSMASDAYLTYKSVARMPSVILVGYFGYGNLGDEETLKCAVKLLREIGVNDIGVLSKGGNFIHNYVASYNRDNFKEVIDSIKHYDAVIFCGGNLLQNETSTASLLYYETITRIAERCRKRIYFISSGIGRITGTLGYYLTKKSLCNAAFLGMRTEYDLSYCRRLSHSTSALMPDLCFLLNEEQSHSQKESFAWFVSSKRKLDTEAIDRISASRGLKPIIILLFPSSDAYSYDHSTGLRVYAPKSYEKIAQILSECAFTVSERLHGGIFSMLTHTPCYLFADCEKNNAMIEEISLRSKGEGSEVLLPYSESMISAKKEIGAKDSDFEYLINGFKTEIKDIAIKLFQLP